MKLGRKLELKEKAMIGMVHVRALPGTPYSEMGIDEIAKLAVSEAKILSDAGFDAIIVENMHDRPYLLREVGPEIVASMTRVVGEIRQAIDIPIGVQILAGANRAALAVAQTSGASFIRVEGFVFAHVADEGLMNEASAASLLRYRKQIGADDVAIYADIKKKHSSHAITDDIDLSSTAEAAAFFGADGVIVTGGSTGEPVAASDLVMAQICGLPVWIGSGITPDNLTDYWDLADGFVIGSGLKEDGKWLNRLEQERVDSMMRVARELARRGSNKP